MRTNHHQPKRLEKELNVIKMSSSLVGYSIGFGIGGIFNPNFSIVSVIMITVAFVLGMLLEYKDRKINQQ